jgi:hypothetical protein
LKVPARREQSPGTRRSLTLPPRVLGRLGGCCQEVVVDRISRCGASQSHAWPSTPPVPRAVEDSHEPSADLAVAVWPLRTVGRSHAPLPCLALSPPDPTMRTTTSCFSYPRGGWGGLPARGRSSRAVADLEMVEGAAAATIVTSRHKEPP